ncbi:MAG: hypothetical protein AVDCRST_MAG51-3315 [uncultured Ramlibacter sp.]|uniref:Uncharacterized protein n=1 Tax=uncultured Ramlibacter sp. TaxID=260755 RepID=A0A6J4QCY6_9BURK|nr:MAG: hypothetical protein AVDCRST_MAG51-3315 [uncultured Ramlibacter sp.]
MRRGHGGPGPKVAWGRRRACPGRRVARQAGRRQGPERLSVIEGSLYHQEGITIFSRL